MVVTTFYKFADLTQERVELRERLQALEGIGGLVILAPEGLNGTIAGSEDVIQEFREILASIPQLEGMEYKDSPSPVIPFARWKVELKEQTILYKDKFKPQGKRQHLSPTEWHEILQGDEPVTVLDTRNKYETQLGVFQNAVDPEIDKFTEFSDYLESCELPKDRKTLIYCTGGIRCEKAILDMEERGFKDVHQLDGGILKYLEEFPDQCFDGECFVFDRRVAVKQDLEPTDNFWLCPHCGDPGQLLLTCEQCQGEARLCKNCASEKPTCSKDCNYHWLRVKSKT